MKSLGPGAGEASVEVKERITALMNRVQSTDDAKFSMGVNADETEEMIGTAVREIVDELSKNFVTRNDDTAEQDTLDRLDKNHVAENGKLDMAVQNTLGPLYKDHPAENDEIDVPVQETSDRLK